MKVLNFNDAKFVSGGLSLGENVDLMLYAGAVAAGIYSQISGDSYLNASMAAFTAVNYYTTGLDVNNYVDILPNIGLIVTSTVSAYAYYSLGRVIGSPLS